MITLFVDQYAAPVQGPFSHVLDSYIGDKTADNLAMVELLIAKGAEVSDADQRAINLNLKQEEKQKISGFVHERQREQAQQQAFEAKKEEYRQIADRFDDDTALALAVTADSSTSYETLKNRDDILTYMVKERFPQEYLASDKTMVNSRGVEVPGFGEKYRKAEKVLALNNEDPSVIDAVVNKYNERYPSSGVTAENFVGGPLEILEYIDHYYSTDQEYQALFDSFSPDAFNVPAFYTAVRSQLGTVREMPQTVDELITLLKTNGVTASYINDQSFSIKSRYADANTLLTLSNTMIDALVDYLEKQQNPLTFDTEKDMREQLLSYATSNRLPFSLGERGQTFLEQLARDNTIEDIYAPLEPVFEIPSGEQPVGDIGESPTNIDQPSEPIEEPTSTIEQPGTPQETGSGSGGNQSGGTPPGSETNPEKNSKKFLDTPEGKVITYGGGGILALTAAYLLYRWLRRTKKAKNEYGDVEMS